MDETSNKFTGLAQTYAKHRPSYPKKAVEFVVRTCNLTDQSVIADIGCGTGISTRLFARQGIKKITGVEPNQDMRTVAESETKNTDIANDIIIFQDGSAENTNLESETFDVILSAQAFHWFDRDKALREFHRILKPDGFCVLMWNVRNETDSFTHQYGDIMFKHSSAVSDEVKRVVSGKHLLLSDLFESVGVNEFSNNQVLDEEGLIGRAVSTSYAPRDPQRVLELKNELSALFKNFGTKGSVTMKYTTSVYIAKKIV